MSSTRVARNYEEEIRTLNFSNLDLKLEDLIEFTIHILKKPITYRTEKENEVLKEYIKQTFFLKEIIKQYGDYVYAELREQLDYRSLPAGQKFSTISGSSSQCAFILLKGAIQIFPTHSMKSTGDYREFDQNEKDIETNVGTIYGDFTKFDTGIRFAETTYICRKESHFAVLSKKEYEKIAFNARKRKFEEQIAFLSSLSIFQGWSMNQLKYWPEAFKKEIYIRKHLIYKQEEDATHIYVIKSGSVLCTKNVPIKSNILGNHEVGIDDQNQVFIIENEVLCRKIELAVLGPGQVLGDEEALEAYFIAKKREMKRNEMKRKAKRKQKNEKKENNDKDNKTEPEKPEGLDFEGISVKRETNMIVTSPEAELWSMPITQFFTRLETHKSEVENVTRVIADKKKRRDDRIALLSQSSQKYAGYLQTQKTSPLKGDIVSVIKTKKFGRHLVEDYQTNTMNLAYPEGSPVEYSGEMETLKTVGRARFIRNLSAKAMANRSAVGINPKSDQHNQGLYNKISKRESINSNVIASWIPRRSQSTFGLEINEKSYLQNLHNGESPGIEEEEDKGADLIGEEKKKARSQSPENKAENQGDEVKDVRTSVNIPTFKSRTSFVRVAVTKKTHVQDKLNEKSFSKSKLVNKSGVLDPKMSSVNLSKVDINSSFDGPDKWRLMTMNSRLRKKFHAPKKPGSANQNNSKQHDERLMVMNFYRKLSKMDAGDSFMKLSPSRDGFQISRQDFNRAQNSFYASRINLSVAKAEMNNSREDFYSPKVNQDSSFNKNPKDVPREDGRTDDNDVILTTDESDKMLYPRDSSSYLAGLVGRKDSKEENRKSYHDLYKARSYISGLFPGFKTRSIIKKDKDSNEIYRYNLRAELEKTSSSGFKVGERNRLINTSPNQRSGEL